MKFISSFLRRFADTGILNCRNKVPHKKPNPAQIAYDSWQDLNAHRQGRRSLIWKWIRRIVLTLAVAFIALYCADWAVYKLRGSPQGSVKVSQTLIVPLKGNKQEYDYLGTSDVPCSVSIFSQGGESACWQLRRNQNQDTKL
jgi:hypothetical protein